MCRITGFWDFNYDNSYPLEGTLVAMRDSLKHGGPDSDGIYLNKNLSLGLGHRRLAILDLSAAGHQPMFWKHWVIVYNGEVFNFQEVRKRLETKGYDFQTGTDTEVILKAFKAWGAQMVDYFRGFFAFAIFNSQTSTMTVFRDRVGVKPMYWYWKDGLFMFASELKAFHKHPKFDKAISLEAVSLFLQQGYIPAPHCIFEHVQKLKPGAYLEIDTKQQPEETKYWDVREVYSKAPVKQNLSTKQIVELELELEDLLTESFELRMVADVPVGTFLSGGIDSSLVTALLQKKEDRQLKTFTIGFHDKEYNEAEHAKAVAKHLGTEHHEFYCTEQDFEAVIPLLPEMYDEPFGDSSGIPTYLVSKMAREHVTVSLSADGGDEIFGGYTKYEITKNFYPKIRQLPTFARGMLSNMGERVDPLWLERNSPKIPVLKNYKNVSNKFPKLINALKAKNELDFFNISSTYIGAKDLKRLFKPSQSRYENSLKMDQERMISYLGMVDIETYLEGDIMTKVDRATMAVALEGRDPFLDHKIIEFGMKLPDSLKIGYEGSKHMLRSILYDHVPKELIERPKQGFSIPVQKWLMHSLKDALLAMKEDQDFATVFHLETRELSRVIDNFLYQRVYINPHFIWFLYTLHQWYLRWLK